MFLKQYLNGLVYVLVWRPGEKKTSRSENWTFSTVNNSETTCSPELQCVSLWHLSEVKIAVISWLLPKVEKEKIAH